MRIYIYAIRIVLIVNKINIFAASTVIRGSKEDMPGTLAAVISLRMIRAVVINIFLFMISFFSQIERSSLIP